MNQLEFQEEVIDRLARIETKQDTTNGRVTKLENEVDGLRQSRARHEGASRATNRLAACCAALFGTAAGAVIDYFFRR